MSLLTGIDNAPNAPGSELAVQLKVWAMMVMAAFTLEVTGVTFVFQFSAVSLLALIGGGITLVLVATAYHGAHSRQASSLLAHMIVNVLLIVPALGLSFAAIVYFVVTLYVLRTKSPSWWLRLPRHVTDTADREAQTSVFLLMAACGCVLSILTVAVQVRMLLLAYRLRRVVRSDGSFEAVFEILYRNPGFDERLLHFIFNARIPSLDEWFHAHSPMFCRKEPDSEDRELLTVSGSRQVHSFGSDRSINEMQKDALDSASTEVYLRESGSEALLADATTIEHGVQ